MKFFKGKKGCKGQGPCVILETSEIEMLKCENGNKDRRLEQLTTELEYQKSESQAFQNISTQMRELLADLMIDMSQLSRRLQSSMVHNVLNKSSLTSEYNNNIEVKASISSQFVAKVSEENLCLNTKLQEVSLRLHEAEQRMAKNRDWIANAKSVLKERELLVFETRQLLKQKEKELRVYQPDVMTRGCDDHSMGDRESKVEGQLVAVTEAAQADPQEPELEAHPLFSVDSGVQPGGKPQKVDYFARFMQEVQHKKKSGQGKPEDSQLPQVAPPAHYAYGSRATADFHYKMSDLAAATFL